MWLPARTSMVLSMLWIGSPSRRKVTLRSSAGSTTNSRTRVSLWFLSGPKPRLASGFSTRSSKAGIAATEIVGIRIHNIKDQDQKTDVPGHNPLDDFKLSDGTLFLLFAKHTTGLLTTAEKSLERGLTKRRIFERSMERTTKLSAPTRIVATPRSRAYPQQRQLAVLPQGHHGAPTMFTESDEEWLRSNYPGLIPSNGAVSGTISFTASYDRDANKFFILGGEIPDRATSVVLSGTFQIRIAERADKSWSHLPALYVQGMRSNSRETLWPSGQECVCLQSLRRARLS